MWRRSDVRSPLVAFSPNALGLKMNKQRNSQISLATLILCLYMGSLFVLPMNNIASLSMLGIFEADNENYSLFDQVELDEDDFIVAVTGATTTSLISLKPRSMNLDFKDTNLSLISPPPKRS
jgi:hypothetical protein